MSEHLRFFTDIGPTLIGFFLFIGVFVTRVVWTFFPEQIRINKHLSELPLERSEEQ